MNLKIVKVFFSPDGQGGGTGQQPQQPPENQPTQQQQNNQPAQQSIDYAKIQQMLDGTLAAKEDTALKAYFKQQGLSQEEAEQAMSAFKAEKAKNQPDVNAIQTQLAQTQVQMQKSPVENAAILEAVGMGLDAKTKTYVLKMAD